MSEFTGFTQDGLTFLQQISQNNNKEWFEEHRAIYDSHLLQPMRKLVTDLSSDMLMIDELFETRPAIGKTISRMNRDTRFSHDKSLYRNNLWLTFKRSRKNWTDAPTYFLSLAQIGGAMGWVITVPRVSPWIFSGNNCSAPRLTSSR